MNLQKFAVTDASFERSPDQDGDIFTANMIDQRHGTSITIGYCRYAPNQRLDATMEVHDVMIVLEGRLSVESAAGTVFAGPGEIVSMSKGDKVTIRSNEDPVLTAYVTHPH